MHNIGTQLKLPVEGVVVKKGRKSYIVRYEAYRCRVHLFDWQEELPTPKHIYCRLVSINEFGFPSFEQIAQQEEVKLIEPVKPKEEQEEKKSCKDQGSSFNKGYGSLLKQQSSDCNNVSKKEFANITNYYWRDQEENFEKWFISTGGIKKRIEILISLAEQLADYHRNNKVYKDLVPEYINIETTKWNVQAVILETNYTYSGLGNVFIYASHAAPEVVNRRMPNTPMSDCYSFAIIVHELLAFCHPFVGDAVEGKDSMNEAMRGNLPWIDDSNDHHNWLTKRLYDTYFTTPEIRGLFKQTFEIGKEDPMKRPSMHEWIDALYDAASHLKHCPECNTEFIYTKESDCPFCGKEDFIFPIAVAIQHIDKKFDLETYTFSETEKELYPEPVDVLYANQSNKLYVNSRHLLTDTLNVKDVLSIEVVPSEKGSKTVVVVLKPLNGFSFYASTINGERYARPINAPTKIVFPTNHPRKLILSLKQIDESQRVLNVQLNNDMIYAED